jgi:hypothetical protein
VGIGASLDMEYRMSPSFFCVCIYTCFTLFPPHLCTFCAACGPPSEAQQSQVSPSQCGPAGPQQQSGERRCSYTAGARGGPACGGHHPGSRQAGQQQHSAPLITSAAIPCRRQHHRQNVLRSAHTRALRRCLPSICATPRCHKQSEPGPHAPECWLWGRLPRNRWHSHAAYAGHSQHAPWQLSATNRIPSTCQPCSQGFPDVG